MKNICVFCGSSDGIDPIYKKTSVELGRLLVSKGLRLVYGGGNIGLMGSIADATLEAGGEVIGVIPRFLQEKEVGHHGLTQLHIVNSMHERKLKMAEEADAFIAMPGGLGTLEELAEIATWVQLELMTKPIGILNVNGYYNSLITMLDSMVSEGFLNQGNRRNILAADNPAELIDRILSFEFDDYSLWDDLQKT